MADINIIRVFDFTGTEFIQREVISRFASATTVQRYSAPGRFEIRAPIGDIGAKTLEKYRIICIGGYFWGRIDEIEYSCAGGEYVTASGGDLKAITGLRVTVPPALAQYSGTAGFDAVTGTTEKCVKYFWNNSFGANAPAIRKITGVSLAADRGRGLGSDKYMSRYEPVDEVTAKLCDGAGLGYTAEPDLHAGKIVFDVCAGVDRSSAQTALPPVIIDIGRLGALQMEYADSDSTMKNAFYTTRSGDQFMDQSLTMTYYRDAEGVPSGLMRRECHLSVSAEHPAAGQEYNEMRRLAQTYMTAYERVRQISAEINTERYKYGIDFNLGDIVTVQNRDWGVAMDARVSAVTIEQTGGGVRHLVDFGYPRPGMRKLLVRDLVK